MRSNSRMVAYAVALVLAAAALASALSIEAEPVKVTHRNSGPRYDIDAVERTRMASANQEQPEAVTRPPPPPPPPAAEEGEEPAHIGHVAIRRIFLFPMVRPSGGDWSEPSEGGPQQAPPREFDPSSQREQESGERESMPSMFAKPFWPFMTPARPSPASHHEEHERPHRPHLFGADEASRPPADRDQDKAASNAERDPSQAVAAGQPHHPLLDPIQVMMDLMHQAISSQLGPNLTDLNNKDKDSANSGSNNNNNRGEPAGDNAPAPEASDERPLVPSELPPRRAISESHEEVVEIEGKKYLRKTVVSRHVGEGIIFMTRRLIFVPLNETDSTTTTTDTTATTTADFAPTTATPVPERVRPPMEVMGTNKPRATSEPTSERPAETSSELSTTTTSTTTEAPTSEPVSSTTSAPEQPTSSEPSAAEATTEPKSSWVERAPEAVGGPAERLVEETAAPAKATPAPASSETAKPAENSA